jgi:Uma2 family endonuclease
MVNPRAKFKLTYEAYKFAPASKRYELLDGDLVLIPSLNKAHQCASGNLYFLLRLLVNESGVWCIYIAPFDVVLSNTEVVQPDLMLISSERSHIITEDNIQGAPDLVIEVLSPTTAERDRTYKRTLYARHGVQEYWLVDTDARTIEVLRLGEQGFEHVATYRQGQTLVSPLLKGLELSIDEVF